MSQMAVHLELVEAALSQTEIPDLPPLMCVECDHLWSYGGADWAHVHAPEDACMCNRRENCGSSPPLP